MYQFARDDAPVDLAALRERLALMPDQQLLQFGRSAAYLCTPEANYGRPPQQCFVVQLVEARQEWRRRRETRKTATSGLMPQSASMGS